MLTDKDALVGMLAILGSAMKLAPDDKVKKTKDSNNCFHIFTNFTESFLLFLAD